MDAVKFLQERERMCTAHHNCDGCTINGVGCGEVRNIDAKRLVDAVEEWSAAHPIKTRQSIFLEHYPNANPDEDGVLQVCPNVVEGRGYVNSSNCGCVPCEVCRRAYWMQEVK